MKCFSLFRREDHSWQAFGQDADKPDRVIDTNQYLVRSGDAAILLDPGGIEVFPAMLAALTREIAVEEIKALFLSHQDPDIGSSLPLWRRVCPPGLTVYLPWLWEGFVSHFDREATFTRIPDEGMDIALSPALKLRLLPAHYLHSSGNFHVYDPAARILFSGDVGTALFPDGQRPNGIFVTDFARHVPAMEQFHRRWMPSPAARDAWIEQVSRLEIDILAPQHGLVFRGDDVKRFLDWFAGLDLAAGLGAFRHAAA